MNTQSACFLTALLLVAIASSGSQGYRLNCEWACQRGLLQRSCNCAAVKEPKRSNLVDEFDYDALFDTPSHQDNSADSRHLQHQQQLQQQQQQRQQQLDNGQPGSASRTSLFRWGKRSLANLAARRR